MAKNIKKRAIVGGAAAAILIAGVSVGGALVTKDSTIADNIFGATSETNVPAEMTVDGQPMENVFSGVQAGEYVYETYNVNNLSDVADLKFNLSAKPQVMDAEAQKLYQVLDTQIVVDGKTIPTGKLANMAIPTAELPTVTSDSTKKIKVEVFVNDPAEFQAADIADDTELTVDFLFDSIFITAP